MTAATPAPERDSTGTPDGRTYSGPADAATPGQDSCGCPETDGKVYHQSGTCTDPVVAELDWYADRPAQPAATPGQAALKLAFENWLGSTGYDEDGMFDADEMEFAFEAGAEAGRDLAALAQPQPRVADGNAPELRITDCSAHGDALHIQVNTGHNWLCAVALAAILAEYEPQPEEPQPAPGPAKPDLGTAWRLLNEARALIAEIISEVSGWSRDPLDTDQLIDDWRVRARMEP